MVLNQPVLFLNNLPVLNEDEIDFLYKVFDTIESRSQFLDDAKLPLLFKDKIEVLRKKYEYYFSNEIIFTFHKLEGNKDFPADSKPHCDRYRTTAINYVLSAGGDAKTFFFKESRKNKDASKAEKESLENLTLDHVMHLPSHVWHMFNPQKYHSVGNVTETRLLFSIVLKNNISPEEFKLRYSYLL